MDERRVSDLRKGASASSRWANSDTQIHFLVLKVTKIKDDEKNLVRLAIAIISLAKNPDLTKVNGDESRFWTCYGW